MNTIFANLRFHSLVAPVLLIVCFLLAYLFFPSRKVSNVFSLFCLGALGGTLNTYFRLRDLPTAATTTGTDNLLAIIQVYVSPVVAGAFAIVMFMLLASRVLEGPLFPKFVIPDNPERFIDFLWRSTLADGTSSAKLCFWAFVAGFAERLIPNIIDRLVVQAGQVQ